MTRLRTNVILFLQACFGRFMRRLLGRNVVGLLVESPEGVFAVDPEDHGVGGRLRRRGSYGEAELARLRPLLRPDASVLVVGAHVGTLAIPLAKNCLRLVAIEANPRTHRLLLWNLAVNGISNCRVLHTAVSDKPETIRFQMARNNSGSSRRVPARPGYADTYDKPEIIAVDASRLDDLLPGEAFDLVLMDIEGSECLALRGAPELLRHAGALAVEFTPEAIRDVAGSSVAEFAGLLAPHFDTLYVPSRDAHVRREAFREVLEDMARNGESDAGLLFRKSSAPAA